MKIIVLVSLILSIIFSGCGTVPATQERTNIANPPTEAPVTGGEYQANQSEGAGAKYAQSLLSGEEADFYRQLYQKVSAREALAFSPRVSLGTQQIKKVVDYFYDDHPEFYWGRIVPVDDGDYRSLYIKLNVGLGWDKITQQQGELEGLADEILLPIADKSDYEKALFVHDYIGENIIYDYGFKGSDSDNAHGAITSGVAYCDGYARAFQYLAGRTGLESIYIRGRDLKGTTHAWNGVMIDGGWYYVDTTWDRASVSYAGAYHNYFAVSLADILDGRVWDTSQYTSLPESDGEMNFYRQSGYETSLDGYTFDSQHIKEIAEICNNQLALKENLENAYSYSFVEFRVSGSREDYEKWKSVFTKELFNILSVMEKEAREKNLPFSVSYNSEVSCYYSDDMQVVAFYPKVKVDRE